MSKLKPCPFCGSDNLTLNETRVKWYRCEYCLAEAGNLDPKTGDETFTKLQAVRAWNRRAE